MCQLGVCEEVGGAWVDSLLPCLSRRELYHVQRELLRERTRCKALEEELENPMNIHRWRKLEVGREGRREVGREERREVGREERREVGRREERREGGQRKVYSLATISLLREVIPALTR